MTAKHKFDDTIVTNAGRKLLIRVGAGKGIISYTRAGLYGQSVADMDDYDIRNITALTDQKIDTPIKSVSTVVDNSITISASFSNKTVDDDLEFNCIGWYAKMTTDDKETLLGITPTNGTLTLAAHSPDNVSTESINVDFSMAISNAAKVDLTVNEVGVVYKEDLEVELTRVKDGIDKEIAAGHYTKAEIDSKLASLGDVKTVNGVKPDSKGNVAIDVSGQIASHAYSKTDVDTKLSSKADASNVYSKTDVDSKLNGKANTSDVNNELKAKANAKDVYTKTEVDTKVNAKANSTDVTKQLASKANSADVYTQKQVDDKLATKADKTTTYTKTEVDTKVNAKANTSDVNTQISSINSTIAANKKAADSAIATKANQSTTYTKTEVDSKDTAIKNTQSDHENRLKFLEQNAGLIKRFTSETDAKTWSNKGANYIGVIED